MDAQMIHAVSLGMFFQRPCGCVFVTGASVYYLGTTQMRSRNWYGIIKSG